MNYLSLLLMFALINSCIELEISAPSFPSIISYFGVSETMVGLTITYNLVAFCIASMIYGPLSECYGRRRVMLWGNGILAIGAMGCVIAPSIYWLLLSRFIQGFGAATSAVVVSAIIADHYKIQKATKLYGMMNAVFTTLMAIAPVAGGFINQTLGWRGNYAVVALICVISWFLLLIFLPETNLTQKKLNLKKIIFDYKTLLSSSLFLSTAAAPSLLYACYLAFVSIAPFIYMTTLNMNMLSYTFHQAIVVAAFAITSIFSGKITDYLKPQKTLHIALGLSILGPGLMIEAQSSILLTTSMSLFSIGFALIYPIVFARSMEIFPDIKGTASSTIMNLRYLLCATVTAIASHTYHGNIVDLASILSTTSFIIFFLIIISSKLKLLEKDQSGTALQKSNG